MVYYRKKRVTTKRRFPVRKRKYVPRKRGFVPRGVSTIANIPRLQRHRYCQQITLDPTAGGIAVHHFSANNLCRPDYDNVLGTNGSHQPMRYDDMGMFYSNHTVIGAKMVVRTVGQTTSPQSTVIAWGVHLSGTPVTPTDYKYWVENGLTKFKLSNMSATSNNQTFSSGKFSAKRFFNIRSLKDNFDRLGSPYDNTGTSGPVQQAYFTVWSEAMKSSLDGASQDFLVIIDYIVLWSEPKDTAAS